ncbi:MAG: 3-deoxy-manno-octulosonate cytidylyltransferase [Steroidobacteraceae bacterium]
MFRVVIPARWDSSRFPGKPLASVDGAPMIVRVHERARASRAEGVIVATDDERIATVARAAGADVCLTAATHASGTDRIAEVARLRGFRADDIVVNLQGDEPRMPAVIIDQVAAALATHPDAAVATAAAPLVSRDEYLDPNVVKVVTDADGRALYFSRAPIPWDRDAAHGAVAGEEAWQCARRHIGIYAYRVGALLRIASLAPTRLERLEKLEQLRALEHGLAIRVVEAAERPGADINTPEDLAEL